MSVPLIILMSVLQLYVSIEQGLKHNWAGMVMFGCYAGANIAYIWIIK